MNRLEDSLEKHVPYYLTQDQKANLVGALRAFPEKTNYYASFPESGILQGDCFNGVPISRFGSGDVAAVDCVILSNTCDVDPSNKRPYPARIVVAPLIPLEGFRKLLESKSVASNQIESQIDAIKNQAITNVFYLPKGGELLSDRIARFDECYSLPMTVFTNAIESARRLASLSQIGFYLLTFKLSIHFCRMHEGIQRDTGDSAAL